jgi:hypothetical protein
MGKLIRAGLEAVTTIVVTLGIIVGAFSTMFGVEDLLALSGTYYVIWAALILVMHLAYAMKRRHLRLGIGIAIGVIVMGAHLAMYLTGNIDVDINLVPVILHDFGLALVSLVTLNLVHLVIFRRRLPREASAPAAPDVSQRVDDIPDPTSAGRTAPAVAEDQAPDSEPEPAKSA